MHLVEISVVDQRYQAVMAVLQEGWKVSEVAERLGVARQTVHGIEHQRTTAIISNSQNDR